MRRILIIGIGTGDPDHLTLQAVKALARVDVIFTIDKGAEKADLVRRRMTICEQHMSGRAFRTISIPDPKRDRHPADYESEVVAWHALRLAAYEQAIVSSLADGECGAFLVWGDPSLYDSTLRILERLSVSEKLSIEYEVIPGITSIQALTAKHRICLNQIGQSVHITTGRNLAHCQPTDRDNVAVMLDGELTLAGIDPRTTTIHWGAYLGTEHEILRSGRVADVIDELRAVRAEARKTHSWIMDTYLLSKCPPA